MSNENWTLLALLGMIFLIVIVLIAIALVSGHLAFCLGFKGWMWWCVTILFFIVISCLIGMINRIGA